MKYIIAQIIGAVLVALGGQGGLRLLANENDAGFLASLPGDVGAKIGVYVAIIVAGATLTSWAYKKFRAGESKPS
jgi:hypothetical protein